MTQSEPKRDFKGSPIAAKVGIGQILDGRPIGWLQAAIVMVGFVVVALDGFDVVVMSYVAPVLRTAWHASHGALGVMLSAGLIGQALGAMVGGPIGDRFGRKIVIVSALAWFGLGTLASAFANDVQTLGWERLFIGLGLGASIPAMATLISEYAPTRHRSLLVTLALAGFTIGAASGGFIAAWVIPAFGWRDLLLVGGFIPVVTAITLAVWLPESIEFLARNASRGADLDRVLKRLHLEPEAAVTLHTLAAAHNAPAAVVRMILSDRMRLGTLMLWLGYAADLFAVYLLSSWLPTLMREGAGYDISHAALIGAMFQIGGPLGAVSIGRLMDRLDGGLVLAVFFLLGACDLLALGYCSGTFLAACLAAATLGFCLNGGAVGMNAYAASFYPLAMRTTGLSWMTACGRLGATASALAGGGLLTMGWQPNQVLSVLSIPAVIAAGAMAISAWQARRDTRARGAGHVPDQISQLEA